MKKSTVITLFVVTNIMFIFLQVHKRGLIITQTFRTQKNEKFRNELAEKKHLLNQQLQLLKNRSTIKQFARTSLQMEPVKMSQIRKLPHNE